MYVSAPLQRPGDGLGGNLLVAIGYSVLCFRHKALDEALSTAALATIAGDENTLTL